MIIKLLHLNILYGRYIDALVHYLKDKDFDILCFQEVGNGRVSAHGTDNFEEIKTRLGYHGEKAISWHVAGDNESYEANAILFKPTLKLISKEVVWLKEFAKVVDFETRQFQADPRTALMLELEKDGKTFSVVTTHLSWGPNSEDEPHKLEVGKKLFEYMQHVQPPFILTGDFNVNPSTKLVSMINKLGRNLTADNHVTNTLNPRTHKATHLFPPGLAVDYIYVTEGINIKQFKVLDSLDISDHLGLYLEFEL